MSQMPAPSDLIPGLSPALVEAVERLFPDRLPSKPLAAEEVARLIGQQDVVRKLRAALDEAMAHQYGSLQA